MRTLLVIIAVVAAIVLGAWFGRKRAAAPPALESLRPTVTEAAREAGLDPHLVLAVVAAESSGNPRAVSPVGARGLMQLMPPTAEEWAGRLRLTDYSEERLFDIDLNLKLGCAYLAHLLKRFDGAEPFALAAYNAGPTRVRRWREAAPDVSPAEVIEREGFEETRTYVKRVLRYRDAYAAP